MEASSSRDRRSSPAESGSARRRKAAGAPQGTITHRQYWRKQIKRIVILLAVWFVAGYLMSIFLVEPLNAVTLGGMPFGFWMAQQGSIFVFIGLILIYAISAGRLDRRAGVAEGDPSEPKASTGPPHD